MVTRETFTAAATLAGTPPDAADRLVTLHDLLAVEGLRRGLIGPREGERLARRHLLQCAALAPLVKEGKARFGNDATTVDVGTGAGLPGLVLACLGLGPVLMLESDRRRAGFVAEAIDHLGVEAHVIAERAETAARDPALRDAAAVAVARALAKPPVALELVLPFAAVGGACALVVGETAAPDEAARSAAQLGGGEPRLHVLQVPGVDDVCRAMIVDKVSVTPERYPRRAGVPGRRPLGTEA